MTKKVQHVYIVLEYNTGEKSDTMIRGVYATFGHAMSHAFRIEDKRIAAGESVFDISDQVAVLKKTVRGSKVYGNTVDGCDFIMVPTK